MVKLTRDVLFARCRSNDLAGVRKLNCWGNELDDISIIQKLPNIEVVSLSVNDITSLADFQHCKNLQELYIRKNKIANLNEICYLKKLPKLRMLWLADNPCATGNLYRMTVLRNLPNLVKLDNIVVDEEEVNDALEQGIVLSSPAGNTEERSQSPPVHPGDKPADHTAKNPNTLTLQETNKIRTELGLKPLSQEQVISPKSSPTSSPKAMSRRAKHKRSSNILSAIRSLLPELKEQELQEVIEECRERLDCM